MKWDNYEDMVSELPKDPAQIIRELTPTKVSMWHAATGVVGEAGELIDAVKKCVIYNQSISDHLEHIIEEMGDLEFYMEQLRQLLGLNRNQILNANMRKLNVRYGEGYSDKAAKDRKDKSA
jgi:NTP pyrophosphatase (non-canonical NTP hydrolase)